MAKINIKSFFSIISSKLVIKLSKLLSKGGTNFPGTVALKLDKNVLKVLTKNYKVILVTGTNGKTTTTSMIYNLLKESGLEVITNASGANMITGIAACFVSNYSFRKPKTQIYAVIEVDEANLKFFTEYNTPEIITITNLFRDQLDRYGEVYTTLNKILEGVVKVPDTTLILNGDESLLGKLDLSNKTLFYGFAVMDTINSSIDVNADAKFCKFCKTPYKYDFVTYNHLGKYFCPNCDYERPNLDYAITDISEKTTSGSHIAINNIKLYISQAGTYNIYNALCAYSIARELNISDEVIINSFQNQQSSFGRQEAIDVDGKKVKVILVKNPAGYDEAINTITLEKNNIDMTFLLNDKYADGTDVSWIWDVKFEKLIDLNINKIIISGERLFDMAIRLKIAGFDENNFSLCDTHEKLLQNIKSCESDTVYVLATYTAMTSFRQFIHSKGYARKIW
ncbi:MAG: Mur ligase family protein [Clostridium sp.]